METIRRCLIVAGITGTVAGALLAIGALATGEWRFSYDARITQFYTCEGQDLATDLPGEPVTTFPTAAEQIYACGYLETSDWVRIGFVVFSKDEPVRQIYHEKFDQGYFVVPICSRRPCTLQPGLYRVEMWRARHLLGSTDFTVAEEKP